MASCENCTKGYVLPGEPKGNSLDDGAYYSPSGTAEAESAAGSRAVVLLTDIFGLALKNSKIIADELAQRLGCDVYVPDFFQGHPPVSSEELEPFVSDVPGVKKTLTQRLRLLLLFLPRIFVFWSIRPAVVDARVTAFVKKLREDKKYAKVGAVGYCFGGGICCRLGSTDTFDSLVIAHPGLFSIKDVKSINKPTAWVCAEEDDSFPKPMRDEAEAGFAARKDKADFVDYEFVDYKGTVHGFACRPNLALPAIMEAYQSSITQTVDWFKKTL